jgi:hypothetical protein
VRQTLLGRVHLPAQVRNCADEVDQGMILITKWGVCRGTSPMYNMARLQSRIE